MLVGGFRPWGTLSWVLDNLQQKRWDFLGTLATEDRCLATWEILRAHRIVQNEHFYHIVDLPDARWEAIAQERLGAVLSHYDSCGGQRENIREYMLDDKHWIIIQSIREFVRDHGPNVVIDCSCFPKRFFFPMVKELVLSDKLKIQNIIATYTIPSKYADDLLAADPQPWHHLPRFMPPIPEPQEALYVVGLGYEPLGLPQLLVGQEIRADSVRLLFPFPAAPPGYQKNWSFVHSLEPNLGESMHEPIRVNGYDVSEVYERILSITDRGKRYTVFAPYGPKPMSLAMCLYASTHESLSAVYYTQPRSYNPEYSQGVKVLRGEPQIYAYCIRIDGRNLYL